MKGIRSLVAAGAVFIGFIAMAMWIVVDQFWICKLLLTLTTPST
jgi:hypothetical protein